MYKDFFGLNRNPFELSPDPSFMCPLEKSKEALASIKYAVAKRKGFVVMTGEVGTGKTLIVRSLFELWKSEGIEFANIFAPRLPVIDFLINAASDLGIKVTESTKGNLLRVLYGFLVTQFQKGLTTVLVIDEAHQMPTPVLEEIRLLTNFETAEQKLVQILLVGQPELDKRLDSFELRSLKQRIAVRCQLEPLSWEETCHYIEGRLKLAGANSQANTIFPAETIRAIYRYSLGIPRLVNSICDQALIAAYAGQVRVVPVDIVDEVASYFRLQSTRNLEQTETLSSLSKQKEEPLPDISSQRALAVNKPAAEALDPNAFSSHVKALSAPPAQVTPPGKPEASYPLIPISSREDTDPSASTIRVTEVSTVKTDSHSSATATSEKNGGKDLSAASPVVLQLSSSIPELRGDAQSVPGTRLPLPLTGREKNLSLPRNGPQKNSRAKSREGIGTGLEYHNAIQNSRLIAAIALVFVLIGCGMFWLWSGTAGNAAAKLAPVVEQITQSSRNSNPVPEVKPASQSVAIIAKGPQARELFEWKQRQPSTPAKQSVPNVMSGLSGSMNVHHTETQEIDTAPAPDLETVPPNDNTVHTESSSSSGLATRSPSDSTSHGPPQVYEQVNQPRLLSSVLPTYPASAQRIRVQGNVVIQTLIDQTGKATDIQVVSGPLILRQAALDALHRWRYEPGSLNGQPVSVQMLVTIRFQLSRC